MAENAAAKYLIREGILARQAGQEQIELARGVSVDFLAISLVLS